MAVRKRCRRAEDHDRNLPPDLQAGIVVVIQLRCGDSEADEDQRRPYSHAFPLEVWAENVVLTDLKLFFPSIPDESQRALFQVEGAATKRHVLKVRPVDARRLEAHRLEGRGDVLGGQLETSRPRLAALEQIVRQESNVGSDRIGFDASDGVSSVP